MFWDYYMPYIRTFFFFFFFSLFFYNIITLFEIFVYMVQSKKHLKHTESQIKHRNQSLLILFCSLLCWWSHGRWQAHKYSIFSPVSQYLLVSLHVPADDKLKGKLELISLFLCFHVGVLIRSFICVYMDLVLPRIGRWLYFFCVVCLYQCSYVPIYFICFP